jgi:hypothetical protein
MVIPDPNSKHKIPPEAGERIAGYFLVILFAYWVTHSMYKAYLGHGEGGFVHRTMQNMFYCWAIGPHYDLENQDAGTGKLGVE